MGSFRSIADLHDDRFESVIALAERCHYEVEHSRQVAYLALRLFDELGSLHGLGDEERFWLQCGAILHDIGWLEGQQGHNKTSLRMILDAPELTFGERERVIIGLIARYHRKALPKERHAHFGALDEADRETVRALSALLRVADGLDRSHFSVVDDLECEVLPDLIIVRCAANRPAEAECRTAWQKGDLLAQVFDRRLFVKWYLA